MGWKNKPEYRKLHDIAEGHRLRSLFEFMHGKRVFKTELNGILKLVDLLSSNRFGYGQLLRFCLFYPIFMYPALRLQKLLRRKFFGERYELLR